MHSKLSHFLVTRLVIFLLLFSILPMSAFAEVISITCGTFTTNLDTSSGEVSTGNRPTPAVWSYDGETLLIILERYPGVDKFFLSSGVLLTNGLQTGTNCRFRNPEKLETMRQPHGVALRNVFVSLPLVERQQLQQNLADFDYYFSAIDGLWGKKTEAAVLKFYADRRHINPNGPEFRNEKHAREILSNLAGMIHEGDECDGCVAVAETTKQGGDHPWVIDAHWSNSNPFSCNSHPFSTQSWTQENARKFDVWKIQDEIEYIFRNSEKVGPLRAADRLTKIYTNFGSHPWAAEYLGYILFEIGEYQLSAYWALRAAEQGVPSASYYIYHILASMHEYHDVRLPKTLKSLPRVFEDCLRFAFSNGEMRAGPILAATLVGLEGVPKKFHISSEGRFKEAIQIVNALPNEIRHQNEKLVEEILFRARSALEDLKNKQIRFAKERVASLESKCDGFQAIKGLCWAQTLEEMKTVLRAKDFTCGSVLNIGTGRNDEKCVSGRSEAKFEGETIVFSCANFNACSYNLSEMAREIVDRGLVERLKPDRAVIFNGTVSIEMNKYCGRTEFGQKVCVQSNSILGNHTLVELTLSKGAFGEKPLSFD